ncbi:MAG: hypothetical protein WA838_19805 [Xanthobacteraceae bacterium]
MRLKPAEVGDQPRALQIHWQKHIEADDRSPTERMRGDRQSCGRIGKDRDRDKRFDRGTEAEDESRTQDQRAGEQRNDRQRQPRETYAAQIKRQHERRARRDHQGGTYDVKPVLPFAAWQPPQHGQCDHERDRA